MRPARLRMTLAIAFASLASSVILPADAGAKQLSLYRAIFFDAPGDANDHFFDYGTTSDTALLLSSGLDVVATPHHIDFLDPESQVYGTADCTGIAGGTVGYGHISGSVSGTTTSNAGEVWNYTDFRGSWVDTVVIHAPTPALSGTYGIFTATVLVEVAPSLTANGTIGVPNVEASAEVGWILSDGGNLGSAYFRDSDETDPDSLYSIIGSQPMSPAPSSVPVPVVMAFQFDIPFDLGLEFYAYGQSSAMGWAGPGFPAPHAFAEHTESFLNTVAWQGIDSVRDAFDAEVTGWTIMSDSGTDYATAVPEPAGAGSFLAPIGGLVWLARRRAGLAPID